MVNNFIVKTANVVNFFTVTTGKQIQCQVVKKFVDIHNLTIISKKTELFLRLTKLNHIPCIFLINGIILFPKKCIVTKSAIIHTTIIAISTCVFFIFYTSFIIIIIYFKNISLVAILVLHYNVSSDTSQRI